MAIERFFALFRGSWRNLACALALTLIASAAASAQTLSVPWVEVGENGKVLARIVVSDPQACPTIQVNGASRPMSVRQPMPDGLRPVCEFPIPPKTKAASVNGHSLPLPKRDPARVVVLGDTGCRIKGRLAQDCNHPETWPFLQVSGAAAQEKPDLVIHVGDYLYRESPCPEGDEAMCGGSPAGDNWDAWNADFFTPASALLSAAPWAFTRGNHEDCNRTWRGWFYYFDPRPWDGNCAKYPPAYLIKLKKFELAILDTSAINEFAVEDEQVARFSGELASLHPRGAWLSSHYPFWGFTPDTPTGKPAPLVAALQAAWEKAAPAGYSLILGGHIHLFEYVSIDDGRPPQLIAGDAGTRLDVPIEAVMKGAQIRGARVAGGQSRQVFGYTLLTRHGKTWSLELKDRSRRILVSCNVPGSSESCQSAGSD